MKREDDIQTLKQPNQEESNHETFLNLYTDKMEENNLNHVSSNVTLVRFVNLGTTFA